MPILSSIIEELRAFSLPITIWIEPFDNPLLNMASTSLLSEIVNSIFCEHYHNIEYLVNSAVESTKTMLVGSQDSKHFKVLKSAISKDLPLALSKYNLIGGTIEIINIEKRNDLILTYYAKGYDASEICDIQDEVMSIYNIDAHCACGMTYSEETKSYDFNTQSFMLQFINYGEPELLQIKNLLGSHYTYTIESIN